MPMRNFFRTRRHQLNKSQFEMAVAAGVTPTSIQAWERGTCLPRMARIDKVAQAYQVTTEQLLREISGMVVRGGGASGKTLRREAAAVPA